MKHPKDLATHPSLSRPYIDPALGDMVRSTEQRLQQERINLWRAKNLNRQFLGDVNWLPCEAVETSEDWDMFGPRSNISAQSENRKRKRSADKTDIDDDAPGREQAEPNLPEPGNDEANQNGAADGGIPNNASATDDGMDASDNVSTVDAAQIKMTRAAKEEDIDAEANPTRTPSLDKPELLRQGDLHDTCQVDSNKTNKQNGIEEPTTEEVVIAEMDASDATSPAPPTRRITRALAANTNVSNPPTPHLSPTSTLTDSSTSSLYQIDPIFLLPAQISAQGSAVRGSSFLTSLSGLSIEEGTDIRKLLTMYIQKQEETVRGYEAVLGKLTKAKRMKEDVLEMCKAEGHVGEMSDGEDWVDTQKWGLGPGELKKGKDEEDEAGDEREVTGIGGRKGKRRRN